MSRDVLEAVLQFVSTIAHGLGVAVVGLLQRLLPAVTVPPDLVDPVGFLAVLTLFVVLAGAARRLAWILVVAGWVLIGVRVALLATGR